MGNQITAIAPAQILPLENYFNDLTDYGKPNRSVPRLVMSQQSTIAPLADLRYIVHYISSPISILSMHMHIHFVKSREYEILEGCTVDSQVGTSQLKC